MCTQLTIQPRDVLFFRDARPMGGSHEGSGATWPMPTTFHSALQSALYRKWPERNQEWESEHRNFSEKEKFHGREQTSRMRFGGLKTNGPFPVKEKQVYFPTPSDIHSDEILAPFKMPSVAKSNLPLTYAVGGCEKPTKQNIHPWISAKELTRYLFGKSGIKTTPSTELYDSETRPGLKIDPETGANEDKGFYQAQYLRLRDNVEMMAFAECISRKANGTETDMMAKLFEHNASLSFIFGGQQGVAHLDVVRNGDASRIWREQSIPDNATRIKWVLLSPAVFNAGWRPDWVDNNGAVQLKDAPVRSEFGSRGEWREAIQKIDAIDAKLVAARISGATHFSGWSRNKKSEDKELGPKRTLLSVPAGSVYYFEADTVGAAQALVRQLHGRVKSSWYGEQGLGLGVCGTWDFKTIKTNKENVV